MQRHFALRVLVCEALTPNVTFYVYILYISHLTKKLYHKFAKEYERVDNEICRSSYVTFMYKQGQLPKASQIL